MSDGPEPAAQEDSFHHGLAATPSPASGAGYTQAAAFHSRPARSRPQFLRILARSLLFLIEVLGTVTLLTAFGLGCWWVWYQWLK